MIDLFWRRDTPRYGDFSDTISYWLCRHIAGQRVRHRSLEESQFVAAGSVLESQLFGKTLAWEAYRGCVWGAGRMSATGTIDLTHSQVRAVRGALTLRSIQCSGRDRVVVGEPGLLAHLLAGPVKKRYVLGIVPTWREWRHPAFRMGFFCNPDIKILDVCAPAQTFLEEIGECRYVLSASLGGLIAADALGIPNQWLRFGYDPEEQVHTPDFIFHDYYSAFGLSNMQAVGFAEGDNLKRMLNKFQPYQRPGLTTIQERLLAAFPRELCIPGRTMARRRGQPLINRSNVQFKDGPAAQRIVLVIGTGRCGLASMAELLRRQPNCRVSHRDAPNLEWIPPANTREILATRFARFRYTRHRAIVGDASSTYLNYVEQAIALEPNIRIVCLRRPQAEVIQSFSHVMDKLHPLRINHWATTPPPGWSHDPIGTRLFPQYDSPVREEGIGRYWDEYYVEVQELVRRFPEHVQIFDTQETLTTEDGIRRVLTFVGIPAVTQVVATDIHLQKAADVKPRRMSAPRPRANPNDPRRCVVLVPYVGSVVASCGEALDELERRGYVVRRVSGFAAIDQGRSQLATDAILDGFEETLWIDSDVAFNPNDVEKLRGHQKPVTCAIYAKKGVQALASRPTSGTSKFHFGKEGGLHEIMYSAGGFVHVRREVYLALQRQLRLPVCNEGMGRCLIPYFYPTLLPYEDGTWYLAEDFAFSHRVRECGYKIWADTTIRLWHIGQYQYGWEDAGEKRPRRDSFEMKFHDDSDEREEMF